MTGEEAADLIAQIHSLWEVFGILAVIGILAMILVGFLAAWSVQAVTKRQARDTHAVVSLLVEIVKLLRKVHGDEPPTV